MRAVTWPCRTRHLSSGTDCCAREGRRPGWRKRRHEASAGCAWEHRGAALPMMVGAEPLRLARTDGNSDGNDGTHPPLITATSDQPRGRQSPRPAACPILRIRRLQVRILPSAHKSKAPRDDPGGPLTSTGDINPCIGPPSTGLGTPTDSRPPSNQRPPLFGRDHEGRGLPRARRLLAVNSAATRASSHYDHVAAAGQDIVRGTRT